MRKTLIVTAGVLVLLSFVLFGWRMLRYSAPAMAAMPPLPVSARPVVYRDVPNTLEAVGALRAVREVTLSAETAGRVTSIGFEAGAYVRQGALIISLFDAPERADLAAARAKANFARLQLLRAKNLASSGAVSRELLQQRQSECDQTVAAVLQIEARLIQKAVRALICSQ